jgi:hypothetical protein
MNLVFSILKALISDKGRVKTKALYENKAGRSLFSRQVLKDLQSKALFLRVSDVLRCFTEPISLLYFYF